MTKERQANSAKDPHTCFSHLVDKMNTSNHPFFRRLSVHDRLDADVALTHFRKVNYATRIPLGQFVILTLILSKIFSSIFSLDLGLGLRSPAVLQRPLALPAGAGGQPAS